MHIQLNKHKINSLVRRLPDFKYGMVWEDPVSGHRIACLDASKKEDVDILMNGNKAALAIQDPHTMSK